MMVCYKAKMVNSKVKKKKQKRHLKGRNFLKVWIASVLCKYLPCIHQCSISLLMTKSLKAYS